MDLLVQDFENIAEKGVLDFILLKMFIPRYENIEK